MGNILYLKYPFLSYMIILLSSYGKLKNSLIYIHNAYLYNIFYVITFIVSPFQCKPTKPVRP
jgi:hypothetical protein